MKIVAIALSCLLLISCGKKSSSKNDPSDENEIPIQKTESPIVGSLKRAGATKSVLACTQNYIPGNEEALENMRNEYTTDVESCVDEGFTVACIDNKLKTSAEIYRGLVNWWSPDSDCRDGFTKFTDEKSAMEFLKSLLDS